MFVLYYYGLEVKAQMKTQSVEPKIADLANWWLGDYGLDYRLEQESLNMEIDNALKEYFSKNGGAWANRPDAKLLLQDDFWNFFPILIEYKWYKDKLVKLDSDGNVENRNLNNEPNFKNINSYAVNGAIHYANALLHYTSYTDIIAIGMTGLEMIFETLNILFEFILFQNLIFELVKKSENIQIFHFWKKKILIILLKNLRN